MTVGRTPLIALSPKKTWEGFVGGAIGTMAASVGLTWLFAQFQWMYCPREELSFGRLDCARPAAFEAAEYHLTDLWEVLPHFVVEDVRPLLGLLPAAVHEAAAGVTWACMPAQMHAIALAAFASIIGPFGAACPLPHHCGAQDACAPEPPCVLPHDGVRAAAQAASSRVASSARSASRTLATASQGTAASPIALTAR